MHDVIHDVAKSIAMKDPHRFVVNEDFSLQEWKKRSGELEMLVCKSIKEFPKGLVCPKLGFILLDYGYPSSDIPDTIFEGMREVRVVSLSQVYFSGRLPSSLQFLSNLRTLSLNGAYRLKGIEIIGELKKLQILSIAHCKIEELPEAMKGLSDLRMLSLRYCDKLIIPRNVISSLSRLEHLSLRQIFPTYEEWHGKGEERMAWMSELKHLSCLKALEVEIPSPCLLPKDAYFNNLARYDIFIGYQIQHNDVNVRSRNTSRGVKLYNFEGPHLVKCFSKLFKTIEVLDLRSSSDDIKHFVHELGCDGFPHLKYLSINCSYALQYIMNTMEMEMEMEYGVAHAFPLLEELHLIQNCQLEAVCHGPIPIGCFANLRVLRIEGCRRLKYVLWQPTAQGRESILEFPQLQQLELLSLSDEVECFYSTGINRSTQERPLIIPFFNQIALPRLELLSLVSSWPRMSTVEGMHNVGSMWDNQYPVDLCCKLKKVVLSGWKNLQTVFPSNFVEEGLQSLEFLSIGHCPSLKEIFEIDRSIAVINKKHHPQGYPAFQNLKSWTVYSCRPLEYLFSTSMVRGLVQLEVLEISNCPVEKIVVNIDQTETETETEAEAVAPMSLIFPRLTSLKLSGLWKLKRFCEQEKYTLGFPLLKKLEVHNCDNVELLFQGESIQDEEVDHKQPLFFVNKNTFPNVEELKLSWGSMEIWGGQFSRESFGKLRNLEIEDRHNISVVIPSSRLRVLHNLQLLTLRRCDSVKEIIQMEELTAGETETETETVLQKKSSGKLHALHNLKKLALRRCNSVEKVIQVDDDHEQGRRLVAQSLQGQSSETETVVLLPHLTEMYLEDLPMLTHIFGFAAFGFGLRWILLQNLHHLHVSKCGNLINILSLPMANRLVQLKKLYVTDCSMVKEIVGDDDASSNKEEEEALRDDDICFVALSNTLAFPSLEEMEVKRLPRLTHIYKKIPPGILVQSLQNLRVLTVSDCGNLENLFTLSLAKTLVQLKEIYVMYCDKVKEIVENDQREGDGGDQAATIDHHDEIIFTKLQTISLRSLRNLKSFCSARYTFRFPCLTCMDVIDCPEMEYFCKGDSVAPRLENINVDYSFCRGNDLNATIQKKFMKTHSKEEDLEEASDYKEEAEELRDSEEQHPKVENSMEEDTKEEDSVDPCREDPHDGD